MSLPEFQPDRADRILILTARAEEYRHALEGLDSFSRKLHQNHPYYHRATRRFQTRILHLGVGPGQVRRTLGKLSGVLQPDFVILAGTAGSLSEDLSPGSFYLPTAVVDQQETGWFYPEEDVLHWAYERLGMFDQEDDSDGSLKVRTGPMVSVTEPVRERAERERLRESYQALAVDMETHTAIQHFQSRSTPPGWVSVRVVSDGPETESRERMEQRQSPATQKLGAFLGFLIENF